MGDIASARTEIQKVVALLVNRFGSEEDVFKHLTLALDHLQEPSSPGPIVEQAAADLIPPEEAPAVADLTIDSTAETLEVEAPPLPLEEPGIVTEVAVARGAHRGRRNRRTR